MLSRSIGTNIKQLRVQRGFSQDALAEKLFVTRQTISNYETGKSQPDIDTLQRIATELDVDLEWLLYGKPMSPRKKASFKSTMIAIAIFATLSILTFILLSYTYNLKLNRLITVPNIIIRLILVPMCFLLFGAVLMQIIDWLLGIVRHKKTVQKVGKIVTLGVLGVNFVMALPYILWCFYILFQIIVGTDSIASFFPAIPVYTDIALAFLKMAYNTPYLYTLVGIALWLFYSPKRDRLNNK